MASISSRGMALSQWVDAQAEPWASILRWSPLGGAFLLGMLLGGLWKWKALTAKPVDARGGLVEVQELEEVKAELASVLVEKPQTEEKLLLLQQELKAALRENSQQHGQIKSAQRVLEVKDQVVEDLRKKLDAMQAEAAARSVEKGELGALVIASEQALQEQLAVTGAAQAASELGQDLQAFADAAQRLAQVAADFRDQAQEEEDGESEVAQSAALLAAETEAEEEAPVKTEADSEELGLRDWRELLLFVSSDPSIWNQAVNESESHFAIPLSQVPSDVAFLRMRRLDTGQGIVLAVDYQDLISDGGDRGIAFNGSNEEFYGAYHLGIYSEMLAQEVEIRFALGGWGFGHRANSSADSFARSFGVSNREAEGEHKKTAQACAWAGREIDSATLIEIVVFPRLPDLAEGDQLL
ncbi:MAG: hypothetical protein L3J39_09385 [Verrucomicrobiales bacterium]|nr:hypothetical protein [Verrucomicrobiales bacterium]